LIKEDFSILIAHFDVQITLNIFKIDLMLLNLAVFFPACAGRFVAGFGCRNEILNEEVITLLKIPAFFLGSIPRKNTLSAVGNLGWRSPRARRHSPLTLL
jgi:hypothetical protein